MIRDGWYCCPKCKRKLFPVTADTIIKHLDYMCRHCKEKFEVNI